jgi:hypothetical protein
MRLTPLANWGLASVVAMLAALCISRWLLDLVVLTVGSSWMIAIMRQLVDWGVPESIAADLFTFIAFLQDYVVVALFAFALRLTRYRWLHRVGLLLCLLFPIADLLVLVVPTDSYWVENVSTLFSPRPRVASALTAPLGVAAWYLAAVLTSRRDRDGTVCPQCGYDTRHLEACCPECGASIATPSN